MKKSIFLTLLIAISIGLLGFGVRSARAAGNGVFEIIDVGSDSVEFKVVSETNLYSVEFVAGKKALAGAKFSNSVGDLVLPGGAKAWPGSSFPMPSTGHMSLITITPGIYLIVSEFKTPKNFKAEKIKSLTQKGAVPMVYDIATSAWESAAAKP